MYFKPREVIRDGRLPLSTAVDWVRVSPSEVAQLSSHRARLTGSAASAEELGELGTYTSASPEVELWPLLEDEARRMQLVCGTREGLGSFDGDRCPTRRHVETGWSGRCWTSSRTPGAIAAIEGPRSEVFRQTSYRKAIPFCAVGSSGFNSPLAHVPRGLE